MQYKKGIETKEKILRYIKDYFSEHGYAPSYREIGRGIGIKSTNTIYTNMIILFKEGELETDLSSVSSRAYRIAKK